MDPACPWEGFDPATISFCEARLCALIAEPASAFTSLSKSMVGVAVLVLDGRVRRSALSAIGVAAVLLGLGGFAFHSTGTFWGEALDVSGMFLISGMFLTFPLARGLSWPGGRAVAFYVTLVAISVGLLLLVRPSGIYVFALQVAVWIGVEVRLYRRGVKAESYRQLQWLIVTFAIGFFFWNLDKHGLWCDPDNHLFTGHAAWHLLTSMSILHFYRYQRAYPEAA